MPIPLDARAKRSTPSSRRASTLNAYVDDELYVAEATPEARAYADFQRIPIHAWATSAPG